MAEWFTVGKERQAGLCGINEGRRDGDWRREGTWIGQGRVVKTILLAHCRHVRQARGQTKTLNLRQTRQE